MSVDPDITRQIMAEELAAMRELSASYGWKVTTDLPNGIVIVTMKSAIDEQTFTVEANCDGYKALPPYFEFLDVETGVKGQKTSYPADGSFFHTTPCICIEWNRKAYSQHGGPHNDWIMTNWMNGRKGMTTLGDMFHLIQRQINKQGQYKGRMTN